MKFNSKQLTRMALFVAIGTLAASFIWFPAVIARAYPIQHAINVIAAVTMGTGPAVIIALAIGALRNLMGLGTILAFPGGVVGAFLAGLLYEKMKKTSMAAVGEVIGTTIGGSLLAIPLAILFMGTEVGILAFMPGFFVSSITGSLLGLWIARKWMKSGQRLL